MIELSPGAVVLIAIGLAIIINGLLLLTVARSGTRQQIRLFRTAARKARDPWQDERQALQELSEKVASLTPGEPRGGQDDDG